MARHASSPFARLVRGAALIGGPLAAVLTYLLVPEMDLIAGDGETIHFGHAGRATLAVMVWMAIWWLTEAIDISATALLPLAVFPVLGIATIGDAAAPYGSPLIFLFLGGFVLALGLQKWGLDRRVAQVTLSIVGTHPVSMIGGFMLVTAGLSMWVSNTATAAMMLPIALSVIDLVMRQKTGRTLTDQGALPEAGTTGRNFALAMMLGIAYAASIGGIGTIIGSPPNGILVQFVRDAYDHEISFARWMMIGLPVTAVFLPIAWLLVAKVLYPVRIGRIEGGRDLIRRELADLGPMSRGEWAAATVFLGAAGLWIFRPLLAQITIGGVHPFAGLTDAGIAITAAMALFLIPVNWRRGEFAMDWKTAVRLPWGILILFGGGLSLAAAVRNNGVAEVLGVQVEALAGMPVIVLILVVAVAVIFLTELTSNTATTATLVPILAALAPGLGVDPYMLIFPATIAASCAFMMPVATPPNAIVFGSGYITIPQMCKAGFWLNLVGVVVVTLMMYALVMPLLMRGL